MLHKRRRGKEPVLQGATSNSQSQANAVSEGWRYCEVETDDS